MSSALTKRLEFTESGYIHSVKDVVSALNYYFSEAEKKDAQLAEKKSYSLLQVLLLFS